MKRLGVMLAVLAFMLGLFPNHAISREKSLKSQLIGTWTLVSWEQTLADGSKNQRFGSNPKGINTFDAKGNFSLIIMRPDLPKISAGDPEKPTAEEAAAIAKGAIAYFGTYTVNEFRQINNSEINCDDVGKPTWSGTETDGNVDQCQGNEIQQPGISAWRQDRGGLEARSVIIGDRIDRHELCPLSSGRADIFRGSRTGNFADWYGSYWRQGTADIGRFWGGLAMT